MLPLVAPIPVSPPVLVPVGCAYVKCRGGSLRPMPTDRGEETTCWRGSGCSGMLGSCSSNRREGMSPSSGTSGVRSESLQPSESCRVAWSGEGGSEYVARSGTGGGKLYNGVLNNPSEDDRAYGSMTLVPVAAAPPVPVADVDETALAPVDDGRANALLRGSGTPALASAPDRTPPCADIATSTAVPAAPGGDDDDDPDSEGPGEDVAGMGGVAVEGRRASLP